MKVTLNRINDDFLLEAIGPRGITALLDDQVDGVTNGGSPMEFILMGLGGCSAIDIISILKKQRQKITSFKLEVEGSRKKVKEARPFESINVKIILDGTIAEEKAKRAASLTFEKYCSVSLTMEGCVKITHEIILNGIKI